MRLLQTILLTSVALIFPSINAFAAPAPVATGTCAGQVVAKAAKAPYLALHELLTSAVITELNDVLVDVVDQPSYANLLADAISLKNSIGVGGRVVITLSDGTVVIDTAKSNNTYANYQGKKINENHNSRIAIADAQMYQCGLGVESKFSSSTQVVETYVARRLGNATNATTYGASYLNSSGTVRVSVIQ